MMTSFFVNDDDGNLCTEVCFPNDVSVALATFVIADQINVQLVENLEEHNGADAGDGSEQSTGSPVIVLKMVTLMLFFQHRGDCCRVVCLAPTHCDQVLIIDQFMMISLNAADL